MTCRLVAPRYYPNQSWRIIIGHILKMRTISQETIKLSLFNMALKITNLRLQSHPPGAKAVKHTCWGVTTMCKPHIYLAPVLEGFLSNLTPKLTQSRKLHLVECRLHLSSIKLHHGQSYNHPISFKPHLTHKSKQIEPIKLEFQCDSHGLMGISQQTPWGVSY